MKTTKVMMQEGNLCILGPVTVNTATCVVNMCKKYLENQLDITIDLVGVTLSDSASLAVLLSIMRFINSRNGTVRFINLPKQMRKISHVSGLNAILPIED